MLKIFNIIMNVVIRKLEELNIDENFDSLLETMPEWRKEKIRRLKLTDDKRRSLGVGVLLNEAMEGLENPGWAETDNGKPYVRNLPDFHFSLSHSGDYVMCVTDDKPCGCDVEKIEKVNKRVAKRVLSEAEYEKFVSTGDEILFFEFWTGKEAVIKAFDLGATVPLKEIDTLSEKYAGLLETKRTEDGYVYSVCSL